MIYITKKDYIKIADTLKLLRGDYKEMYSYKEYFNMMIARFGAMLKEENPRFDFHKFIDYIENK